MAERSGLTIEQWLEFKRRWFSEPEPVKLGGPVTEQVMSEAELAEFEQNHADVSGYCQECAVPYHGEFAAWPCDAAKLVAQVRLLRAALTAVGQHWTTCYETHGACRAERQLVEVAVELVGETWHA